MRKKTGFKLLLTIVVMPVLGFLLMAPGTFITNGNLPEVVLQKPDLAKYLKDTLDFDGHGVATRIGPLSKDLVGTRVGPYEIFAKPKGTKGDYIFAVTINTEIKFYDKSGKLIPRDKGADGAAKFDEKLKSITIETL